MQQAPDKYYANLSSVGKDIIARRVSAFGIYMSRRAILPVEVSERMHMYAKERVR